MCAVVGADACGDPFFRLKGHVKGGVQFRHVFDYHRRQGESPQVFFFQGHADKAPSVGRHEIDDFRGHCFCGADQVAFIFTVFIIHQDDHLPVFQFFQYFRYGGKHSIFFILVFTVVA